MLRHLDDYPALCVRKLDPLGSHQIARRTQRGRQVGEYRRSDKLLRHTSIRSRGSRAPRTVPGGGPIEKPKPIVTERHATCVLADRDVDHER